jgi:hypothetical protein
MGSYKSRKLAVVDRTNAMSTSGTTPMLKRTAWAPVTCDSSQAKLGPNFMRLDELMFNNLDPILART